MCGSATQISPRWPMSHRRPPEVRTSTRRPRNGTPAGTTRGFGPAEFRQIGQMIAEVVEGLRKNGEGGDAQVEQSVRTRVEGLCARFPIYEGL